MTECFPAKTGEYPRIFPSFENFALCEKDLKDNKDNSLHLGQKYARVFVLGHYLLLVAHSFPRALLSENCSLLGTDDVRGQISEHIFAPNGDYCLYITGEYQALPDEIPHKGPFYAPQLVKSLPFLKPEKATPFGRSLASPYRPF